MGTFLTVVFVFVVIALGMRAISRLFTKRRKPTPVFTKATPDWDRSLSPKLSALMTALINEGYFGQVKTQDTDIVFVDEPALTEMIEAVDREINLTWAAPMCRLRLRRMPAFAPDATRLKYTWLLMTPTHAIGFNRPTDSETTA